jgi:transposase-like protein
MVEEYPRNLLEFERRFHDETSCRDYLVAMRWPAGFVCPGCGHRAAWATARALWLCRNCRHQVSVMTGTIFQDSRLPLSLWFRAMWQVTNQKHGMSAMGLQRALGLGSYRSAWLILHKLRQAMVRPGREPLSGTIEVDETYWGAPEKGVMGRQTETKTVIAVAVETQGDRLGRIRLQSIPDLTRKTLHGFIRDVIMPGSTVVTDGLKPYLHLSGYQHERHNRHGRKPAKEEAVLPAVHRIISLLKRWLMGTHQGAISPTHLDAYLDEFTFRFNRRTSATRGKLFYRLVQQSVLVQPITYEALTAPQPLGPG